MGRLVALGALLGSPDIYAQMGGDDVEERDDVEFVFLVFKGRPRGFFDRRVEAPNGLRMYFGQLGWGS